LASRALAAAGSSGDTATACDALHALGLAARETGELAEAATHLRSAIDLATVGGFVARAVRARTSLALVLLYLGATGQALEQTDLATDSAQGTELGLVLHQRALILQRLGRPAEAHACYRRALRIFRRHGEAISEAGVLLNRGVLLAETGMPMAAADDLRRVATISETLDHPGLAAKAWHNLGFVAARAGDFPRALTIYDGVEERFVALGLPRGRLQLDRCEVLLAVRLIPESRQLARQAADELAGSGHATEAAEALLLVSHAALLGHETDAALTTAEQAGRAFRRQRRPGWLAQAQLAAARARWEGGDRSEAALNASRRARRQLDAVGLPVLALEAGLIAARVALEAGRPEVAVRELERASGARRRGPAQLRAQAWHAEALLRLRRGDRRGALTGLRAGLTVLRQAQAALGAVELRAHAAAHGEELAQLGLHLAVQGGRPDQVLRWAEQWRAEGLRTPPVRPPHDADLAADLAELRRVATDLDEAARNGLSTAGLLGRQAALERAIARRARRAGGAGASRPARAASVEGLRDALRGRAMLELIQLGDLLWSVAVTERSLRLRCLGPIAEVLGEVANLRFALRRMVTRRGPAARAASMAASVQSALHASSRLDDLLLGPSRGDVEDRPLVIVPTGDLHALPWAALPHCRVRPFTVAPSGALWLAAEQRPGADSPFAMGALSGAGAVPRAAAAVLVAGPGLHGAGEEVNDLARLYGSVHPMTGPRADVASVMSALDGARMAHIAAHGTYRADSPLFSSLRLADGPLTVYDLDGLSRPPGLLVLSACDSGVSAVRPGDELMGLSSALLSLGTRSVVAGALVVPDSATRPLMLEFHRRLRRGDRPAAALAGARAAGGGSATEAPEAFAAAASFLCFGAG
jgi:hypothetical protein